MILSGKMLPNIYQYLKFTGTNSLTRTTQTISAKSSQLHFDYARMQELTPKEEEIRKAYQTYAQCPYINSFLRKNEPISVNNNHLVDCLRTGINQSESVSGKFLRGINGTRQKPINDETIQDYIFNNKGFTSTAPEAEARYANTFALGSNSAVIEFDIQKPMKALQQNRYETLFDINAFTADKFGIEKIRDGFYRVFQK